MKLTINYISFLLILVLLYPSEIRAQKFLIPKTVGVQYAGSIGFVSLGLGYQLFRNKKGSLEFDYGYVPKSKGGTLNILATKFAYKPVQIRLKDWAVISPINPGVFLSYHLGKDYYLTADRDKYPVGYYWWSSALREHISLSSEIMLNTSKILKFNHIHNISIYTEINTNDLYLVSWAKNKDELSLLDIVKVGYGLRLHF